MAQSSTRGQKLTNVLGCAIATLAVIFLMVLITAEIMLRRMDPPPLDFADNRSQTISDRNGKLLRAFTTRDGRWRLDLKPTEVSPHYLKILIAYEDKRFYQHGGIDALAMARSFVQLIANGRIISGASTLTMQVGRLLDQRHERTAAGKFHQILRALQLERKLTKHEILTLYLKLAPMGGNIEGVRAASITYFGKEPARLSIAEAALLVALPQSPENRRPDRRSAAAKRARNHVLKRMQGNGVITTADAARAKLQAAPNARLAFPKYAPHLTEQLIAEFPTSKNIKTTIDRNLQIALENLAKSHVRRQGPHLSTAILAIENKTGNVLAHIGSSDYFNAARFGAIDMTRATRSPGSALKPFIYGLAFEQGLAHPDTLIEDRPVRFGLYSPKNFDNIFRGTVTIRKALQSSLNIPAVKVLNAIGPTRLVGRFKKTRTTSQLPQGGAPSLAIALGGVGLKLSDLARLYTGLARGGKPIDLNYIATKNRADSAGSKIKTLSLLDPVAAWHVTDILRGSPPPRNAKIGQIAYKTGTSYGFRDALAIGYDGKHTIAVWIGRPDATATPGLTGRTAAAPILFDAFARISRNRAPFAPAPENALIASGHDLPPPLQRFRDETAGIFLGSVQTRPLMISFPPAGSELEAETFDGANPQPLLLKAEGGTLPFTWLVNGKPIPTSPHKRNAIWQPGGVGFTHLSVIDAKGNVDRMTVRLR